jgi:glucans biosynthesis protein
MKLFKRVPALQLWRKMLTMLFETGHPWITFKDPCNLRSPQQHVGVVHSSNLCTEITLNTGPDEIAVCNLASVNLSAFVDENPHGFGFLQRDREFGRFLDDDNRWERRPSLWIEPIGDWGQGYVTLVEIPSESEVNQNIIAYWRPRAVMTAGSEVMFAWRQLWCWTPPDRPAGATVTLSRGGRPAGAPANTRKRRFMVDFNSDMFADPQRSAEISPQIAASPGSVSSVRTFINRDRKTYRVTFDVDPGNEGLSELRLQLEAQGKPVSESWMYRWTP